MSTTKIVHGQLSVIDEENNIQVLHQETSASDVLVAGDSNVQGPDGTSAIPSNVTNMQSLTNALGGMAFKTKILSSDFANGMLVDTYGTTTPGKIADASLTTDLNDRVSSIEDSEVLVIGLETEDDPDVILPESEINDNITSTVSTWSSKKISTMLSNADVAQTFYVKLLESSSGGYETSTSVAEIEDAYQLGKPIWIIASDILLPLRKRVSNTDWIFSGYVDGQICDITVTSSNVTIDYHEVITTNDALPNPNVLKLTGAVSAVYDGSTEVEVEIPGATSTDAPEIIIPSNIVIVAGIECIIYKENIVFSSKPFGNYDICATLNVSDGVTIEDYPELFRITAQSEQVGDYTLTISVNNLMTGSTITSKDITIHVIKNQQYTDAPKNVLFIGDNISNSHHGTLIAEIQYGLSNGGIVSIGTQSSDSTQAEYTGSIIHECYDSATALNRDNTGFICENITPGVVNPFWNSANGSFDLSYYMTQNGFSTLDAVCINIGINSLDDADKFQQGLTTLIAKMLEYKSDMPIIVSMCTQTSMGRVASSVSRYTRRRQWRATQTSLLSLFDNNVENTVYLATPYFCVDLYNDYETEDRARSIRDERTVSTVTNELQPIQTAVLKMADTIYPYLIYAISEGSSTPAAAILDISTLDNMVLA